METLVVERNGGVVTVTLSRPEKKNALIPEMFRELAQVFTEVENNPDDRVLVLTGANGDFCSGADLAGLRGDALAYMATAHEVPRALHALSIPTIAKVDGVAVGAGWNLALGCDLVVATERARFSQIFVRRALSLDFGGSWLLPKLVGLQKAKELAFFGDIISAADAAELGLVTKVVAVEDLDETVEVMAARLVQGPAQAISLTKQLLNAAVEGGGLEGALRHESQVQANNINGDEAKEAKEAFLAKRDAVFFRPVKV